jgi:putative spermidine/putrescine transport system permease protein
MSSDIQLIMPPPAVTARRPITMSDIGTLIWRIAKFLIAASIFVFLAAPLIVTILSSFTSSDYLEFPPKGFSLKWYARVFSDPEWMRAFAKTLTVTAIAVPISLAFGVLAAYAIGRGKFRGKNYVSGIFLSPLMLPEVMTGTAVLFYLSAIGLVNTLTALVIAHVVVTLPYAVRLVLVSITTIDPALERAAAMLGASPVRIFFTVILPLIVPGLFAAGVFTIVLSIGELGMSVFLAGPDTTTVPILVYSKVVYGFDPTITAVSSLLAFLAFPALLLLDRFVGLDRVF